MQRREYIAALGSLAAGGAAIGGTGAFTSVEATRSVNVNVVGDASAYLSLTSPTGLKNSNYASVSNGQLTLNFDGNGEGGTGVNIDAVSTFDEVFKMTNNGPHDLDITIDKSGLANPDRWEFAPSDVYDEYSESTSYPEDGFYPSWDDFEGYDTTNASGGGLASGNSKDVSVMIDTRDIASLPGGEIRFAVVDATSDEGSGSS